MWSKFNPPVDQDTVKTQFLRRVHADRLKTRFKLKPRPRDRAQIPEMVQYHYKHPPEMFTSLRKIHRLREMDMRREIEERRRREEEEEAQEDDSEIVKDIEADLNYLKALNGEKDLENGDKENELEEETKKSNADDLPTETEKKDSLLRDFEQRLKAGSDGELSEIFRMYKGKGQLQALLKEIQKSVLEEGDEEKESERISNNRNDSRAFTHRHQSVQQLIKSRAVLTPIDQHSDTELFPPRIHLEFAVQMRYRKLTIGTTASSDLILGRLGECQQQSEKHAVIFYDEATKTFELLNYSEHGTEVNGHLYSLNFFTPAPVRPKKIKVDVFEMVTEVIDKKRGIKRMKYGSWDKGTE